MKREHALNFDRVVLQLKTFYDEISLMAKKSSDNPLNKFKLKFVNQTIEEANDILGEDYKPFSEFKVFDEDDLPTNSDVVIMLSQYLRSLAKFYVQKTDNRGSTGRFWQIEDGEDNNTYIEAKYLLFLDRLY